MLTKSRLICLLIGLWLASCSRAPAPMVLSGPTMGTTYTVRWAAEKNSASPAVLRQLIETELKHIDEQMSLWRSDSELSRFNASRSTQWFAVSPALVELTGQARDLSRRSRGAFDITLGPLVRAWGFGPEGPGTPPDEPMVSRLLEQCGVELLEVQSTPAALRKRRADLELNLDAIAPGYAADRIAAVLERAGVNRFLVDIGGEIRAHGDNAAGRAWRVAIDDPRHEQQVPYAYIQLSHGAVATSGGYRRFLDHQGKRYSHLLDPRTGYPAPLSVAAVVVVAPTAAQADGWATALFVLGEREGFEVAQQNSLAALFLIHAGHGLRQRATSEFREYMLEE